MYTQLYVIIFAINLLNFTTALTELLDIDVEQHCMQRCPLQVGNCYKKLMYLRCNFCKILSINYILTSVFAEIFHYVKCA